MSWKQWFADNPEHTEMYEAFRDRFKAEQEDPDLEWSFDADEERTKRADRAESDDAEEHHCRYESVEYYRKAWADKKGYTFKPKEYDPEGKYK